MSDGAAVDGTETMVEQDEAKAGPVRVVLRGVRGLVLDDLPAAVQLRVLEAAEGAEPADLWRAVASQKGSMDAAVKSYSGQSGAPDCRPGKYKAVPHASWFVAPLVIEPPLT